MYIHYVYNWLYAPFMCLLLNKNAGLLLLLFFSVAILLRNNVIHFKLLSNQCRTCSRMTLCLIYKIRFWVTALLADDTLRIFNE